jgi:hypothetical protein
LPHPHLQRLEAAGLVGSNLELSAVGNALKCFEVMPFALALNPATIIKNCRPLPESPAESHR